ncbi:hypothetical protein [Pseudomonas huanghezhanensis]|uniref:hypothetical protein n=1 Tax=Pseudomonas huanghezhanensis TaxID=3002903 RepID=UPI00228694CD|nr:hypothetical protein [Pseudomonas sp. BSw22131]
MAKTQQEMKASVNQIILLVQGNDGSVVFEKKFGGSWMAVDKFTADGAYPLYIGSSATQVSPTNGAAYEVQW